MPAPPVLGTNMTNARGARLGLAAAATYANLSLRSTHDREASVSKRKSKLKEFAPDAQGFDADAFDMGQRANLKGKRPKGKAKRQSHKSAYYD